MSRALVSSNSCDGDGARVFAVSDIHADHAENMQWVFSLSRDRYRKDALLVAGDVSDDLGTLARALGGLRERFARVLFVPGNHELWVRRGECEHSWEKFCLIQALCERLDIGTEPERLVTAAEPGTVWLVPLQSWYLRPEEGSGSLFAPKQDEDPTLSMWADNYFVRWPDRENARPPAHELMALNERHVARRLEGPIISFSHFLPRRDLVFATDSEVAANPGIRKDEHPAFNFTRVAGCEQLDVQIRQLGSSVHVYGHQHRNRRRLVGGILYVSNCLGYPRDRLVSLRADPDAGLHRVG